ncbi:MAG: YhcH/YjgK/YiaL family protein [Ignavibacteriales bacterium]|nr:YhcH/YjgK/YiaL family protein [Ignavibacteriales bacterium]
MIFDTLKHASIYFSFGEKVKSAFTYLMNTNFDNLEPGKYEIDGEDVFAIVQQYDTKPLSSGKWEAHKKYLDIQYVVTGKERMGYSNSQKMIVTEEYNEEKDIMFLKGEGNFLSVEAGSFAVFFPTDIHMPGIAINLSTSVKKVVVKVKVEQHVEGIEPKEEEISPQI